MTAARDPRRELRLLAAIAAGGALGAPARYGLSRAIHVTPGSFPWATFVTNLSGSFVLGLVLALVLERFPPSRYVRPFVATGVLGAYTTYSTFVVEADLLVRDARVGLAAAYVASSVLLGLTAAALGLAAGRALPLPRTGGSP